MFDMPEHRGLEPLKPQVYQVVRDEARGGGTMVLVLMVMVVWGIHCTGCSGMRRGGGGGSPWWWWWWGGGGGGVGHPLYQVFGVEPGGGGGGAVVVHPKYSAIQKVGFPFVIDNGL
jgi:hypothetical protein